jgi:hypothetical protein
MQKIKLIIQSRLAATVLLLSCSVAAVSAQSAEPDSLIYKFDRYRKQTLQEKIFVHIDQSFYLIGETVWFKIYYIDAAFHKPLSVSKVAYVEVLDKNNTPVLQQKVELANGIGKGSFFLPASLQSGSYTFRCYTNWMKNFGPEYFFHEALTFLNPFVKPETGEMRNQQNLIVDFFPEGGHLVSGVENKVGFRISDPSGKGVQARGAVLDSQNDTIVSFRPLKFGLGNFSFTPQTETKYRAIISYDGRVFQASIPAIHEEGYVMRLAEAEGKLKITVTRRFNDREQRQFVYLFSHTRNATLKAEVKLFRDNTCEFEVDINRLKEGVTHFTVFDDRQQPVCERLFFKKPDLSLSLQTKTDQEQYGTRRKVNLKLEATSNRNPLPVTDLSVSVYKLDTLSKNNGSDIFHHLWLSSDLPDPIESPDYYFSQSAGVKEATDNLMLTHGWRRFTWDDIFSSKPLQHLPEYRGHLINGKLKNTDSTSAGFLTYLSVPGKIVRLYAVRSMRNGELRFEVNDLRGQNKLVLQKSPEQPGRVQMEIQSPFVSNFSKVLLPAFSLTSVAEKEFRSRAIAMQVQDIYYEEAITQPVIAKFDSTAFYGKADETYYLDNYTRFPVMEEVMREYVPGVFVRKRKDGFHFIVVDVVNGGVMNGDPMILLDGVPLFDADKIMHVDPRQVRKLEVIKRPYYLGPLFMPGIVSFTTYQGDIAGLEIGPENIVLNYEGLQQYREFYAPRYETQKQLESRMPDKRYLLYWNPNVTTDHNGSADLQFFTSDVRGRFAVVVQGISKDGQAGSAQYFFTVK